MLKNEFSWSHSRAEMFQRCQREYYYNYYGAWGGWLPAADPLKRELYILKNIKNRWAWMGDLVHFFIEKISAALLRKEAVLSEQILQQADQAMRREFIQSRDKKYRLDPKNQNGLVEHEYNLTLPDQDWKWIHGNVKRCLTNFFFSRIYSQIKELDPSAVFNIEKLDNFEFEGVKIYAKPDLAYRSQEKIYLIDWKTGEPAADHLIQVNSYILYAEKKWRVDPQQIQAKIVYLKNLEEKDIAVTNDSQDQIKNHMRDSIQRMKIASVNPESGEPSLALSPMTQDRAHCKWCRFQGICYGRQAK